MSREKLSGSRILLIDDDETTLAVVHERLRSLGCEILETGLGREAVEIATRETPDLVVSDIMLPDIDGYEICRQLKEDDRTSAIPLIFLSANDETKQRVKGLRVGAIDYVVKPFDLEELVARIDIGLRVKSNLDLAPLPPKGEEAAREGADPPDPVSEETPALLPNEEFKALVRRRIEVLDRKTGLLTLVFFRIDQENELAGAEHQDFREKALAEALAILRDLLPAGAVLGEIDPFQVGLLVPKKNKYGAELLMDEFRNLLGLHDFHKNGEALRITLSCGVSEFPNPRIEDGGELEEGAEAALRRAVRQGGDQTVML